MSKLIVYEAPKGAVGRNDFIVRARIPGEKWHDLFVYEVKVDMHQVNLASMVYFDMEGTIEVEVECQKNVEKVVIRPLSREISSVHNKNRITFTLDRPKSCLSRLMESGLAICISLLTRLKKEHHRLLIRTYL